MSKKPVNPTSKSLLRNKAEKRIQNKAAKQKALSAEETSQLIFDLQLHQIELEMQNEELREAHQVIEESRHSYADLYDFAPVGYFTLDKNWLILEVNLSGAGMLGTERVSLRNLPFARFVHKDYADIFYLYCRKVLQGKTRQDCEIILAPKNGKQIYVHMYSIAVENNGTLSHVLSAVMDITERKHVENQILTALEEKELLLKEIHHRVKNNMTVIHSLLELQSSSIKDMRYKEMFQESMSRIKAMALIHENLYRSNDLARIDFGEYMDHMLDRMYLSYGLSPDNVKLIKNIEQVTLGIDKAIPCSLIINELLSNSLKHAFPDNREGEIMIALSRNDEMEVELIVSDNGVGMPNGMDYKTNKSLGLNLVNALITQLRGRMEVQIAQRTEFKITFRSK